MGCGSWTRDSYVSYSTTKGMSVSTDGEIGRASCRERV